MDPTETEIDQKYQDHVPWFKDKLGVLKMAQPKMMHKLKI